MKKFILAVLPLLLAVRASAEPLPPMPPEYAGHAAEIAPLAARAAAGSFPDADIAIVAEFVHVAYEKDGSAVEWRDEWAKALTEKGARTLSSFSTWVSLRYGDAAIEKVEIMDAGGIVRAVDFQKTLSLATDNESMEANIYDPLDKILACAVPGILPGETRRVLCCRRLLKPRVENSWSDFTLLESDSPIIRARYTISAPDDLPPVHAKLRKAAGATVIRSPDQKLPGGRTLLEWRAKDVPQAFPEPAMASFHSEVQHLIVSTVKDWPELSRWYWNVSKPHLDAVNDAMKAKCAELAEGAADENAKTRAIFRFVSQEVRYMGITLEDDAPGYAPHDVNITFDNRYGVCRDKAALLVAMLRLAGIEAYPALINVGPKLDPEVPLPYFNHAIVAVKKAGAQPEAGYELMDPTVEAAHELLPSYLMNRSYLVARTEGEQLLTTPIGEPEANGVKIEADCILAAGGTLDYHAQIRFSGYADALYRHHLMRLAPAERRRWFLGVLAKTAPGAELVDFEPSPAELGDTEQPLALDVRARIPGAVIRGETRDSLRVPFLSGRLGIARRILDGKTSLEERRFTLALPFTAAASETVKVALGKALGEPLELPTTATDEDLLGQIGYGTDAGCGYNFSRIFAVKDGVLEATRSERLAAVEFSPDRYRVLRERLKDQETAERPDAVFAKRASDGDDLRILLAETDLRLRSATSWVSTNRLVREILTYDGKKRAAEFSVSWNPSRADVELVSAVVSNRDGSVRRIAQAEINVMDCSWASAAPRYPASKTMVLSFPGVEKGSVIDLVYASNVTNSSTACSFVRELDGRDSVVCRRLEVRCPAGLKLATAGEPFEVSLDEATGEAVRRLDVSNLPPVPREASQPDAREWRRFVAVSATDWKAQGEALAGALAQARQGPHREAVRAARAAAAGADGPEARVCAIRRFLDEHFRTAGPGIHELPYALAFTAPDTLLAEGYGSAADRANLLFTMLEAVGFECEYLLAAPDAGRTAAIAEFDRESVPSLTSYSTPVVAARWKGGWTRMVYPFAGKPVFHLAGENGRTPPAASSRFGDTLFDPARARFTALEPPGGATGAARKTEKRVHVELRENGAADFDVEVRRWGAGVGEYRENYADMLPEERRRHYRALLGELAENATATRELTTDVASYPALSTWSAYVPGFAVARANEIAVTLPPFAGGTVDVGEAGRISPIAFPASTESATEYEVVFPKGYTRIERIPESFECNLRPGQSAPFAVHEVKTSVTNGVLTVHVSRRLPARCAQTVPADRQALFIEWNRRLSGPAARTIVVGK